MKTKTVLFSVFYTLFILAIYSQSQDSCNEYRKFRLSVNVGLDLAVGSSNTVFTTPLFSDGFTLSFALSGLGACLNGAYFLTKNYGV